LQDGNGFLENIQTYATLVWQQHDLFFTYMSRSDLIRCTAST
jgi:hypothetical protein